MAKRLALSSVMTAFAIILGYVEALIPLGTAIPGFKLGLANIVIVIVLYNQGARDALLVNIVRVVVVGFMFGNLFGIMFSIAGALVSMAVMAVMHRFGFNIISSSIYGGVFHNAAQLLTAAFVIRTPVIMYYGPVLIAAGMITGLIIGLVATLLLGRVKNKTVDYIK